ncbi:MAG: NAD(P)-dependent oxidoreductase [Ignavibacteriae bacterium]|nr:NAD(P)-dependent oxidoreductase [Ignavibacteriota bacterium]MCB9207941.1 NAD(P)-dependent oxidoreductase [Ignavibacteriales bacterium]MCB9258710.1 NAD(P)-dependent oxidoreductase [Ignavibacteriales bacterium]
MKALVTGANGFTSSYLIKNLLDKGYTIKGLVRKTSNLDLIKDLNVELAYVDLAKDEISDEVMKDIDVVYHVGAAYRTEGVPEKYFWDVNVEGTRKLLVAAKKAGVKKFIHCSTVGVQGEIKNPPAKETHPFNPGDYYQESKLDGEELALKFFKEEGLKGTVVRPVGIYGPGDTRFLKLFKMINNGKFKMIGNGEVLYHLTFVEDLVEGFVLAGESEKANNEVFTIGGDGYLTLNELVAKIAKILDKNVSKIKIPVWPVWTAGALCELICKPLGISPPIFRRRIEFFVKDRAFDITKAKSLLNYNPKINLDEGLKRTADWYKENNLL